MHKFWLFKIYRVSMCFHDLCQTSGIWDQESFSEQRLKQAAESKFGGVENWTLTLVKSLRIHLPVVPQFVREVGAKNVQ